MNASAIGARLREIEAHIALAARAAGREPSSVRLVAVSKGHPAGAIAHACDAGQRIFGENYVAELLEKKRELGDLPIEWHFIGRVQRNKARDISTASLVHSVGARRHLEALADARAGQAPLAALLQVNVADEPQKNGFSVHDLKAEMATLLGIRGAAIRGLMTLPPAHGDAVKIFRNLREIRDDLQVKHGVELPELSMGMSGDFREAIAAGATLVRIGTAIFGERAFGERAPTTSPAGEGPQ
jgi:pyridoxal phosphate enzyme (YggS family)